MLSSSPGWLHYCDPNAKHCFRDNFQKKGKGKPWGSHACAITERSSNWLESLFCSKEHLFKNPGATQQCIGVLTIRWPCVCVQVCWWMWWVDEGRAQRRNSFKVQAGKARLGAACTRLSNLILLRRLLVFSCLGFLPENKQRVLWRDWLHIWEKAFLESVKDNFLFPPLTLPLSSLFPYRGGRQRRLSSMLLVWKQAAPCFDSDAMALRLYYSKQAKNEAPHSAPTDDI